MAAIVAKPRFDSSRLGTVVVSTAPARPMRYLFLLVGALVGALAGLLLTWFRSIREEEAGSDDDQSVGGSDQQPRDDDRHGGVNGRPDVRFDEVIDVRGPWGTTPEPPEVTVPPPLVNNRESAPATDAPTPTPFVVEGATTGQGDRDVNDLTPSEAGSIAAALFDRPGATRFSG